MSVDILSLKALRRADVVSSLRAPLASAGAPRSASAATPRLGHGQVVLYGKHLDLVDMLVFQVSGTQVDVNEHLAEVSHSGSTGSTGRCLRWTPATLRSPRVDRPLQRVTALSGSPTWLSAA
jgi:hypothetical protein